jgi:hypothetical protein
LTTGIQSQLNLAHWRASTNSFLPVKITRHDTAVVRPPKKKDPAVVFPLHVTPLPGPTGYLKAPNDESAGWAFSMQSSSTDLVTPHARACHLCLIRRLRSVLEGIKGSLPSDARSFFRTPSVRMEKRTGSSEAGTRDHGVPALAAEGKRVNGVARRRRLELRRLGRTASAAAENEAAKRVRLVSDSSCSDSSDSAKVPPPDPQAAEGAARVPAFFSHGAASVIGRRREMEDAVAIAAPFLSAAAGEEEMEKSCVENGGGRFKDGEEKFFAVFDGHGGSRVAEACRERMHVVLAEEVERLKLGDCEGQLDGAQWKEAMAACFARVDGEVGGADEDDGEQTVGSTAVVAVVGPRRIVVANCGDSRAVLYRGGVAVPLSDDHKVHHTHTHTPPLPSVSVPNKLSPPA